MQNPVNTGECYHGRHTAGANVRRRGKQTYDRQLRRPKVIMVKGTMCAAQTADVGLVLFHHLKKAAQSTGRVGLARKM